MESIGEIIRKLRKNKGEPLRKVAAYLDIDQAVLSKIERGKRKATKEHIVKLAKYFGEDEKTMLIALLSDRILYEVQDENFAKEALQIAEKKIEYKAFKALDRSTIIKQIVNTLKQFLKVRNAWIYGSFSREDDRTESDIDIAVKTDEGFSYFDLAEIQYKLENEVNRKIDVGFIDSFKPHIFKNIKPDLKLIYER